MVEFQDIRHEERYCEDHFMKMMFGKDNDWKSSDLGYPHPEGQEVFGSFA
ncbi:MAG: hypothetical protein JXQ65_01875 [Candidatus Marinimicrobia bacterium]|nr:hypothetical protein [Candidatus Neomarinimicrobiota bacterium]